MPAFVTKEFYDYPDCEILANGFLRVQCEKCHKENLVAFSCKHRGFCPSCGARRMAETPARRSAKDHGGACNVNVHLHQLLIDGAYELNADRIPEDYHKIAPPTVPELEGQVKTIAHRVAKINRVHLFGVRSLSVGSLVICA
ncbi:MAG: transposase zinc-binding domain-containing protein [Bdellovibrionales bacterium]|nr:transposase zinc-binding domain-containing protein [Bdellovibrionales bacterium]